MTVSAVIGQKRTDLSIFDASGSAAVLTSNTSRHASFLEKAGFINDEHRIGVTKMLNGVVLEFISHSFDIPLSAS